MASQMKGDVSTLHREYGQPYAVNVEADGKLARLGWRVFRMGKFVVIELEGAQSKVMLPLLAKQAREVARAIEAALKEKQ